MALRGIGPADSSRGSVQTQLRDSMTSHWRIPATFPTVSPASPRSRSGVGDYCAATGVDRSMSDLSAAISWGPSSGEA
jgi:hypothetical protein